MKQRYLYMLALCSAMLCVSSCIKEEPLNAECDIEAITLRVDKPEDVFFQLSDTTKELLFSAKTVEWEVKSGADITNITPILKITEGATVTPASGVPQDFSKGPVVYTVTSQDGNWSRKYEVTIKKHIEPIVNDTVKYDFENFELKKEGAKDDNKYYVCYELNDDGTKRYDWASGNGGYYLSMSTAAPTAYPMIPGMGQGVDGKNCLIVTTCDTGPFGVMAGKRLAAGNCFIGEFDTSSALLDAMKATRFGKPFSYKPEKYIGYYKYTPGAKYQNKAGKEVAGMVDNGSVYAVFYRNHDDSGNPVVLYGDNVQTSPQIVAIAKVKDIKNTTEWTKFETEFEYMQEVDEELLKNRGYSLTVVFSSSVNGDLFEGAIGSRLFVDEVRVTFSHKNGQE